MVFLAACDGSIHLDGIVTSRFDGTPVMGAVVELVGVELPDRRLGSTGADGCFAFSRVHDRSGRRPILRFSAPGYASATVSIPPVDTNRVHVLLSPDMLSLPSAASVHDSRQDDFLPCDHRR
jgi:hypothetical protein